MEDGLFMARCIALMFELLYGLIYFQTYVNLLHLKCGVCAKVIMVCLKFVEEFSGLNSAAYIYDGKTPGGFECATLCSPLVRFN